MINFTFRGHKISIRNDDWHKLKERFNVENAAKDEEEDYVIRISCPLCVRYEACRECPLNKLDTEYGCSSITTGIFRKPCFYSGRVSRIWWLKKDNTQARRQLRAILRRMDKIEANQ